MITPCQKLFDISIFSELYAQCEYQLKYAMHHVSRSENNIVTHFNQALCCVICKGRFRLRLLRLVSVLVHTRGCGCLVKVVGYMVVTPRLIDYDFNCVLEVSALKFSPGHRKDTENQMPSLQF